MHQRIDDAHWSLNMALVWIACRNAQSVSDIRNAKRIPTKEAIGDLSAALRSGKLIAHGMFDGEGRPFPLETAVWSGFEIIVKPLMFAGDMHLPTLGKPVIIARRMGSPRTRIHSLTVPAARVKKLWPAAKLTAVAEAKCREYLSTEMKRSPDRPPKPKHEFFEDCRVRFPGLGERGFERAWAAAIKLTDAADWSKPGRPRKSSR
jgi:uncharacterized short protein YbdD (DUF466 family)